MTVIVAFKALGHIDTTEGRSGMRTLGYFRHRVDADRAVKGEGVMGYDGEVREVRMLEEHDGVFYEITGGPVSLHDSYRASVRDTALAKLTLEERAELGYGNVLTASEVAAAAARHAKKP